MARARGDHLSGPTYYCTARSLLEVEHQPLETTGSEGGERVGQLSPFELAGYIRRSAVQVRVEGRRIAYQGAGLPRIAGAAAEAESRCITAIGQQQLIVRLRLTGRLTMLSPAAGSARHRMGCRAAG
jgi:hypothetical protein